MAPRPSDAVAAVFVAVTTLAVTVTMVLATGAVLWTVLAAHHGPAVAADAWSGIVGGLVILGLIAGMFLYAHKKAEHAHELESKTGSAPDTAPDYAS